MHKLLLIATGGTIASIQTDRGLAPQLSPTELLSYIPDAAQFCEVETIQPFNIDSTNIQPDHWLLLEQLIESRYQDYDGFVICHGTDTLAYSASALSYLIQNSPKPIILTGSQRPINADVTDAKTNLLDSLRCACSDIGGVSLVFGGHVIAGPRAHKLRTKSYDAFSSVNFPDLAAIREDRLVRYIPQTDFGEPVFFHRLDSRVTLLKLIPGLPVEAFAAMGQNCEGFIIESYGVGGIPDIYLDVLDELVAQGKTVVMATQAPQEGSDLALYQVGHLLKDRYDLLETYDMTLEATVTKLMWALGQSEKPSEVRSLFCSTIRYDRLF